MLPVIHQHFLEGNPCENITIDNKERAIGCFHLLQPTGGAHGMMFLQIIQPDPEVFAIPKMIDYGFWKIVSGQTYVADPGTAKLFNCQFQQRTVTYRHMGFGTLSVSGSKRFPYPPAMITAERSGRTSATRSLRKRNSTTRFSAFTTASD